jgi:lipopolysaccharide biosynthesis protein
VTSSLVRSTRHRVVTRLRLIRMAPRRARALRELHAGRPRTRPGDPGSGRVLVISHVYYPELWPELADRVTRIPGDVDLAVTLVRGRAEQLAGPIHAQFPSATVRVVENRGRDIWPLVQVLDLVPGHDAVLKVHTKKSPHMRNGESWRRELLDGLCGSTQQVQRILDLLRMDGRIGVVAPPRNVLGREFIANNADLLAGLVRRSGRTFDAGRLWFPAGSMLWARPEVLLALGELDLTPGDFGDETGAIDGTLPHALERYLGVIALTEGLAVVESSEVADLLAAAHRP